MFIEGMTMVIASVRKPMTAAALLIGVWFALAAWSQAQSPRNLVPPPGTTDVKTLTQNWSDDEAAVFYNMPQGSKLIPLSWFLPLEQPDKLGLRTDVGSFEFDTSAPGNSNAGHDYMVEFTADEREQLVHYLKSL